MIKDKLFRITTVPESLNVLLKGQLGYLNQYFEVVGISSSGVAMKQMANREGVDYRIVNMEREISPWKDLKSLMKLTNLFRKERPKIVHANTPKGSLLAMVAAKMNGIPFRIYTVTGLRFETEIGLKRNILIWMERITCFCATHVVAESKGVKRMIHENKLSRKNIEIIGNGNINGIDEAFWDPGQVTLAEKSRLRTELGFAESDFIFLFVGRMVGDKGVNELVSAFSLVSESRPDIKLLLVGPFEKELDPLKSETTQLIESNPSIVTVGFQENVRLYMSIVQTLLLASYREGFPNVLLQAGAMKVPCVVTDVNGSEEVIDEKNGVIIGKRSISELQKAMIHMLNHYESFDREYTRDKIIQQFSQRIYYPKLLAFYNRIIN